MKKKRRIILPIVAAVLCYIALGAVLPFVYQPAVKEETKEQFEQKSFYEEDVSNERAAILSDNVDALAERIRLISHARERIILSTFEFRNDESGKDVMAALLAAADRGVEVQILMDGMPAFKNLQLSSDPYFQALSSHENIQIALYNPINLLQPWKLMGRLHDKYLIADDTAYILGGRNTYDYFLGDYGDYKNYDWDVLVYSEEPGQGESMNTLLDYFSQIWELPLNRIWKDNPELQSRNRVSQAREALEERYASMQEEHPDWFADCDYRENTREVNHIELLANPTHCYAKEPVVYYEMTELMKQAEEEVRFHTPYIICNDWMLERLSALGKTVPDIRILLNSVDNGDNFVASSDYLRHKDEVVDTGIPLWEYDGGISNHGKSVLIDGDLTIVGSYNLDLRSTYVDTELMLVVECEELNQELEGHLLAFQEDSRRILDADTYEVPEGFAVQTTPFWKRFARAVFGLVVQPFRCLI